MVGTPNGTPGPPSVSVARELAAAPSDPPGTAVGSMPCDVNPSEELVGARAVGLIAG